ncbi:MAG: LAGLIDADG family homing endonuclease [Candidatus Sungbacteria bacterium]|nr:LAGLIDADG family homing endonuclease [Candidatus Sungbacteria bacterium]
MLTSDYIVGLTDGEGSFTAYIRPPMKAHGSKSYRVECHYYIKLRDDDRPLLDNVQKFFGLGAVVFQKENRPNHHHTYRFQVNNLEDLKNHIIPFFEKHPLRSKKIRDFELFKKIITAVMKKEHHTKSGLEKIQQWKSRMHAYGLAEYGKSVRSARIWKVRVPA